MGTISRPRALEVRDIKKKSESVKNDSVRIKLINVKNSLAQLRNNKDKSVEDLTNLVIELVNILENAK